MGPQQVCSQEQQCTTHTSTVVETSHTESCQDIVEQVCTQQTVQVAASSGLVRALSPAIGHINHHIGKREADPEADADAQFIGLGIGHLGHVQRVAPVAVAHHVPVIAAAPVAHHVPVIATAPVAVPRAPLCHAVTRKVCKTIPVQVPRTIQTPVCVAVPKCPTVPNCVTITKPVCEITSRASPKTICDSVPKTSC